jgi:hypothetical protein
MKERWPGFCIVWIITLIFVYAVPFVFDFIPEIDSYLGGYGPLGIWGTVILTLSGIMLSIGYSYKCVHKKTPYRCVGWGCANDDPPLTFPPDFPDNIKEMYRKELKDIDKGWKSMFPWSSFSLKLLELNKKHLYTNN